jgi:hypothetical protein
MLAEAVIESKKKFSVFSFQTFPDVMSGESRR